MILVAAVDPPLFLFLFAAALPLVLLPVATAPPLVLLFLPATVPPLLLLLVSGCGDFAGRRILRDPIFADSLRYGARLLTNGSLALLVGDTTVRRIRVRDLQ